MKNNIYNSIVLLFASLLLFVGISTPANDNSTVGNDNLLAFESFKDENIGGSLLYEIALNGHEIFPDGHEIALNGHEIFPDGHEIFPDGHEIALNGHEIFPDGHEIFPDGHEIFPDGHEIFPDGHEIFPDSEIFTVV
ncbi:hypothetical protein [Cytobacillus dafuensis]|uniref:Uncharacterized protein n=1 Tax=Cytobacillus dafuensis TaxID=1742359 RepID=A0A5B8Z294_CYTDA|nr:hypothetical protein [Cytobacillus dafuensis]QED47018.1 hypothetical protein FSZ17_07050 [Cytobacillus dafuensis]